MRQMMVFEDGTMPHLENAMCGAAKCRPMPVQRGLTEGEGMSATMFKVNGDCTSPIEVTADIPKYPNYDSEGGQIFENTHFLRIEEAWPKLLREHEATVSLYAMQVKRIRGELGKLENQLADAAIRRYEAIENHAKWLATAERQEP